MLTLPLAAVKARFSAIIDDVNGTHQRVTVTRNGSPVAVIVALEEYQSLLETLEIVSDPAAMAEIRKAEQDIAEGRVHGEEEIRAVLAARTG